jgi:excisionase family DNA binding protein
MSGTHEPTSLLTVQEAAKLLRLSDDTVRRQIKEGTLSAIRVRTTPTGRAQYRIPAPVVDRILGTSALGVQFEEGDPFKALRQAFSGLNETERDALIEQAVQWARAQPSSQESPSSAARPDSALSDEHLRERFAQNPLLSRLPR